MAGFWKGLFKEAVIVIGYVTASLTSFVNTE
jgi:hypothetical protein